MRSNEKGITMVEVILVMALLFVILPILWDYMNSALVDSANINNKVVVQTSVNQLMNNMQRHVQEASMPITYSATDLHGEAASVAEDKIGSDGSIILRKPGNVFVTYSYDKERAVVTYVKEDDENPDQAEYSNIVKFDVVRLGSDMISESGETVKKVNGLRITITGRIDEKSNYTLTNEYYTRNTI